jgi:hypothetical protein
VTPRGIVYQHAFAGAIVNHDGPIQTRWDRLKEEQREKYGDNPWGQWQSKQEWEDVKWMATTKASQGSLEELLKTERVSTNCERIVEEPTNHIE